METGLGSGRFVDAEDGLTLTGCLTGGLVVGFVVGVLERVVVVFLAGPVEAVAPLFFSVSTFCLLLDTMTLVLDFVRFVGFSVGSAVVRLRGGCS